MVERLTIPVKLPSPESVIVAMPVLVTLKVMELGVAVIDKSG